MRSETPLDEALRALANIHRRRLLVALMEYDPREIDDVRVGRRGGRDEGELRRLEATMRHNHLPRLREAGFVRVDGQSGVVQGPRFDEIRPLLRLLDDNTEELPGDWM